MNTKTLTIARFSETVPHKLGFIRDATMLACLATNRVISASEHEALYAQLAEMCRPVYQRRKLLVLTG